MRTVKLSDVVKRANTKEDRFNTSLLYYVGGEHIETDNVVIKERGLIKESTIGPMFYFGFKKGDVLLVSRNPHLRKSGMVFFDGICSEKTFVLETNDERILLQDYLPFIFQSDHFWEYAESHKSGSVNFFLNWSTLANYEFNLPDLDEQKKLAEVLWQIVDTIESYKKLLAKTDEMVKAKLDQIENENYPIDIMENVCSLITDGSHFSPEEDKNGKYPMLSVKDMTNIGFKYTDCKYINKNDYDKLVKNGCNPKKNDVLVAKDGSYFKYAFVLNDEIEQVILSSIAILRPKNNLINPIFLQQHLLSRNIISLVEREYITGTAIKRVILKGFKKLPIPIVPMEIQNTFATFVKKSEESKVAIQASLDSLSAVYKKIIAENLGGSN